jgi:hypothetical protein
MRRPQNRCLRRPHRDTDPGDAAAARDHPPAKILKADASPIRWQSRRSNLNIFKPI